MKAAWPRDAKMVEVCGSAAVDVKVASFWDTGGDRQLVILGFEDNSPSI
jgi:hypothetical protein